MKSLLKWLLAALGLASSVYALFRLGDWRAFSSPSPRLFAVLLLLFALEIISRAERIRRAASLGNRPLSLWNALWINALGDVFGAITPSGMGGEVARFSGFLQLGEKGKAGFKIFAAERFALLATAGLLSAAIAGVLLFQSPTAWGLPSFRYTVLLYLGALGTALIVAIGISRYKKTASTWRMLWWKPDLLVLSALHHGIRVGLLPLVVFVLSSQPPTPLIWVWSFVLCYGLPLLPVPGGGGAIEFAFTTGLAPLLGSLTSETLILWRINSFYLYVISGAILVAIRSFSHCAMRKRALTAEKSAIPQPAAMSINQ